MKKIVTISAVVLLALIIACEVMALLDFVKRGRLRGSQIQALKAVAPAEDFDEEIDVQKAIRKDPKIGALVPKEIWEKVPDKKATTAILFVGACSDCAVGRIKLWHKLSKEFPNIRFDLIVRDFDVERINALMQKNNLELPVIFDTNESLYKGCNVFFAPRAYVVHDQRYIYIQQSTEQFEVVIKTSRKAILAANGAANPFPN